MGQLADRFDIVDVLTRRYGVQLRQRSEVALRGACPLHDDSTPSFDVFTNEQRFYCFGCSRHGDVLDFVQQYEGLPSVHDAMDLLEGNSFSQDRPIRRAPTPSQHELTDEELATLDVAAGLYAAGLTEDRGAREYLAQRGVDIDFALSRGMGVCRRGGSGRLAQALAARGLSVEPARDLGLLSASGFELMTDRIILPHRERGEVRWLTGRIAETPFWRQRMAKKAVPKQEEYAALAAELAQVSATDDERRRDIENRMLHLNVEIAWILDPPKYRNIKGPKPLFWRPDATNKLVLVEGPLDAVVLQQWGIPAAAVLGSSITSRQVERLRGITWLAIGRDAGDDALTFARQWQQQLKEAGWPGVPIVDPPSGAGDPAGMVDLPDGKDQALRLFAAMLTTEDDDEAASSLISAQAIAEPADPFAVGAEQCIEMAVCPSCGQLICGTGRTLGCCGYVLQAGDVVRLITIVGTVQEERCIQFD